MARNKLIDLNDHLFAQLERLSDEDLTTEELEKEIERTKAINTVADKLMSVAQVSISAIKTIGEYGEHQGLRNLMLTHNDTDEQSELPYAGNSKP